MVITLYMHDTTWLPHLHKWNFFLCDYWQMKETTRSRAAFTQSQNLLLNFTQSVKQVLAVTPHFARFRQLQPNIHYFPLSNCARVVLLFPLAGTVGQTSKAAQIKSMSISLLNSKSCFPIFSFLPSRRQSTFYRSA